MELNLKLIITIISLAFGIIFIYLFRRMINKKLPSNKLKTSSAVLVICEYVLAIFWVVQGVAIIHYYDGRNLPPLGWIVTILIFFITFVVMIVCGRIGRGN